VINHKTNAIILFFLIIKLPKKKSKKIFLQRVLERVFFFWKKIRFLIKNFFIEIISDTFHRKRREKNIFYPFVYKYPETSVFLIIQLKDLTKKYFSVKQDFFLIFEEYIVSFFLNSYRIPDIFLAYAFSHWLKLFFPKEKKLNWELGSCILVNNNIFFLENQKSKSNLKYLLDFSGKNQIFWGSSKFRIIASNKNLILGDFSNSILINLSYIGKYNLISRKGLHTPLIIKETVSFGKNRLEYLKKPHNFLLGWKNSKNIQNHIVIIFLFRISGKDQLKDYAYSFSKWLEGRFRFVKNEEYMIHFFEKFSKLMMYPEIIAWVGITKGFLCDCLWNKIFRFSFFLIGNIVKSLFFSWKEQIAYKFFEFAKMRLFLKIFKIKKWFLFKKRPGLLAPPCLIDTLLGLKIKY